VYLALFDNRWKDEGLPTVVFKISNSAIPGDAAQPAALARDWTKQEAKLLDNPPPWGPPANKNPELGTDTAFVGKPESTTQPARTVDPDERSLIGFNYILGDHDLDNGKKSTRFAFLEPVFDVRQASGNATKVLAKTGFGISGFNVKSDGKIVIALQPIFMKLKADGSMDPTTKQLGKWVGNADDKMETLPLTSDGKKVIGLSVKRWGTVDSLALVLEK
jgi:hypothetical protein